MPAGTPSPIRATQGKLARVFFLSLLLFFHLSLFLFSFAFLISPRPGYRACYDDFLRLLNACAMYVGGGVGL